MQMRITNQECSKRDAIPGPLEHEETAYAATQSMWSHRIYKSLGVHKVLVKTVSAVAPLRELASVDALDAGDPLLEQPLV